MLTGDEGQAQYFDFMKWCVEYDPDMHVQFAALKRLPNFPQKEELALFLTQLSSRSGSSRLEPYLSMSMLKMNLISKEELNKRLNGG